jgi:hypothetical protein
MLDFALLEQKLGTPAAFHCLQEIEKAARISPAEVGDLEPDARLRHAIERQDGSCRIAFHG